MYRSEGVRLLMHSRRRPSYIEHARTEASSSACMRIGVMTHRTQVPWGLCTVLLPPFCVKIVRGDEGCILQCYVASPCSAGSDREGSNLSFHQSWLDRHDAGKPPLRMRSSMSIKLHTKCKCRHAQCHEVRSRPFPLQCTLLPKPPCRSAKPLVLILQKVFWHWKLPPCALHYHNHLHLVCVLWIL